MGRYFNTEGMCDPDIHYMVRLEERLKAIKERYVDRGSYFVINRGRQYGKTTTLNALAEYLKPEYIVLFMDFQKLGTEDFKDAEAFSRAFAEMFVRAFRETGVENVEELISPVASLANGAITLNGLFIQLSTLCKKAFKPMVLMIDEVDSASNNQVFVDFLAMLRGYYIDRKKTPTFHSVILAGVYDIKNLKLKLRPDEEHKYNSPWNIAAKFSIDMSFSKEQIAFMLKGYEEDNHTGMDIHSIAGEIYQYTSGYPYLVSAICKMMDEELIDTGKFAGKADIWTKEGITEAVKLIINEKIPLFESMIKQVNEYPDMRKMLYAMLFEGQSVSYNSYNPAIDLASMFGYIKEKEGMVAVSNRIFEMLLYNYFLSEEELSSLSYKEAQDNKSQFIHGGRLDMERVLEKFAVHFTDIYGDNDEKFLEEYGRKFFLLYLKPIINGTGNYYIEAQTRDARRTDVIVDYKGEQFVVELKIWRGSEYNERGEKQLVDYLDYFHLDKGYMLSFNFNRKKETGIKKILAGGRIIVEAVV